MVYNELLGELVDVDGLVVELRVAVFERLLGDEIHDIVVIVNAHHSAVHPCFIF